MALILQRDRGGAMVQGLAEGAIATHRPARLDSKRGLAAATPPYNTTVTVRTW
ncbi:MULTISPECIES: hypothetical protein [Cyanophyceae]|uniref:hypothetical protein n=1 Tax=Cyanophyceae TaxID=3028117 RepID=UPI001683EC10|nr:MULTISPECIES: hypothetical protein [Cyanophyceae]MBD1915589.1 hypothetical protein [Phormidium sp. FACHB-77]MBD2031899.1 hypothetical protein [Phormidium sp. FACHB-322]MBD2050649.1 hypothetical protein [Leptolyngbya sp. FACHB-60]